MNGITGVMPYGSYGNNLATLDGLAGMNNYSGFNTGFMGGTYGMGGTVTDVEGAKQNIANQYDIYATQQSYQGRQATEGMSQAERANNMAVMMRTGRTQDAMAQFDILTAELKSTPQYANYSDSQIKAIASRVYQASTGQDLRTDITNNTSGSFAKGLLEGIPIIGTFFSDNTSKEDLLAHVTDTPVRAQDQAAKSTGALLSGAAGGAAIATGICAIPVVGWAAAPIAIPVGAVIGGIVGLVKSFLP